MRSSIVVVLAGLVSLAVSLACASDEPDELLPGRVVYVKTATSPIFRFVSRPDPDTIFDLPDSTNDPTVEGGSLHVFDSNGDPTMLVTLPAEGWKGFGDPAGTNGYKYAGDGSPSDPCRVVVRSRIVKATCRGSGVTLTPSFVQVNIILTIGTDSKRYCAQFGGTIVRNEPHKYQRKDAPAPSACPVPLTPPYCDQSGPACDGSCPPGSSCLSHPSFGCVCVDS
jgi:hypothetical protein